MALVGCEMLCFVFVLNSGTAGAKYTLPYYLAL